MNGPRSNQPCVAKIPKEYDANFVSNEMNNSNKALDLVTRFNAEMANNRIVPQVYVNIPTQARTDDDEVVLVEPLIRNFEKFNSNSGWLDEDDETLNNKVAQALSHFSYHSTAGNLLLCDIQGGAFNKGFALTDPVIMSHTRGRYGCTDLGRDGIITFFAYHDCNEFCGNRHWQRPNSTYPILDRRQGTSVIYRPSQSTSYYRG